MIAESGQPGNTDYRSLARIVHGTDREPQHVRGQGEGPEPADASSKTT
jgi:hypothetical protein